MPIPDLRLIVKSTIVRYLACGSDTSRSHIVMLEYFRSCGQGIFSEEILSQILDEFPQELTDDLLFVLSPPHLRHLQLTNCNRLSCSGLEKVFAKCQQIQALDFRHCIHLLHPTVFLSIRDKAPKLVSLSFENSEVVSDDVVQVALICCPGLKHLNLSSCQNITDKAFFFPPSANVALVPESKTITNTSHRKHFPGRNLTSVDISGCNSLSTMAVRHLVDLCGPSLTTINLSWTGVGCTALLHLAGLSLKEVAKIVHEADSACPVLLEMPLSEDEQICDLNTKNNHYDKGEEVSQECDRLSRILVDTTESLQKDSNNHDVLQSFSGSCVFEQDVPSCSHVERNCEAVGSSEQPWPTFATSANETKSELMPDRLSTRVITDVASMDDLAVSYDAVIPGMTHLPLAHDDVCSVSIQNRTDSYGSHLLSASDGSNLSKAVSKCCYTSGEEDGLDASCHALDLEATALCSELLELDNDYSKPDTQTNTVSSFSAAVSRLSWALSDLMSNEEISGHMSDDKLLNASLNICPGNETLLLEDSTGKASCDSHDNLVHDGSINSSDVKDTVNVKEVISLSPNCPAQKSIVTQSIDVQTSCSREIPPKTQERFLCKEHFNKRDISPEGNRQGRFQHEDWRDSPVSSVLVWSSEIESADEQNKCSDGVQDDFPMCSHSLNVPLSKGTVLSPQDRNCVTLEQGSLSKEGLFRNENNNDGRTACGNDRGGEKICWSLPEHGQINRLNIEDSSCIKSNFMVSSAPDQGRKEPGTETLASGKVCGTESNPIMPRSQETTVKESGTESVLPDDICDSVIVCKNERNETRKSGSFSQETEHSNSGGSVFTASDMLLAQAYQPRISSLDISNIYYHSKPLGMACLKIFFEANKCLKRFSISWSELDDSMLKHLLQNAPDLESLSLVDCDRLSNLSLISIPVHCPKLSSIDLKGVCYITDHGVTPLTGSNKLKRLSLAEAAIGDSTLENVAKYCGPRIEELDLSWCEDVTDRGLSAMASSCSALQFLGIRQCSAGQGTLNSLATNCHLMTSLNIAGIDTLTDKMLCSLAKNMPLLTEVDVSWNSSLTDSGISALLLHCCKLKEAVLSGLKFITSTPFLSIIGDLQRWRLLEELWKSQKKTHSVPSKGKVALRVCNLETAKSLGDQIPFRSLTYSPSLRHMTLEYSDKVNDDHLAAIVAVCRGTLRVIDYYAQPIEPRWIFR